MAAKAECPRLRGLRFTAYLCRRGNNTSFGRVIYCLEALLPLQKHNA